MNCALGEQRKQGHPSVTLCCRQTRQSKAVINEIVRCVIQVGKGHLDVTDRRPLPPDQACSAGPASSRIAYR